MLCLRGGEGWNEAVLPGLFSQGRSMLGMRVCIGQEISHLLKAARKSPKNCWPV